MEPSEAIQKQAPFGAAGSVDIQLSVTGINQASELFERSFGRLPDTLFVGSEAFVDAEGTLSSCAMRSGVKRLVVRYVSWYGPRWWSVGSERPFWGFGSKADF